MILNIIETLEVRKWEKMESNGCTILGVSLENDQWFKYALNETEEELFKNGLNPKEVLRIYELDLQPRIIVTKWDIYA